MTRSDIIRMAREADCDEHYVNETDDIPWSVEFSLHNLEAFVAFVAALVAAAENERLHAECEALRAQVEAWTAIAHKHAFILTNVRAALKEAK